MFENIIGQTTVVQTLARELSSGVFPSAVLFSGAPFTGKISTALETARILTCGGDGRWSCTCSACRKQRLLVHPNTLLLGWRYFDLEIAAAADVLRRTRRLSAQYLFVRSVRKLTRRFDPILWEGEESKVRRVASQLVEIEEHLDTFEPVFPGDEVMNYEHLAERLDRVVVLSQTLSKALSSDNVPINHLRRASSWLHMTALAGTSSTGGRGNRPHSDTASSSGDDPGTKIVVVESADRMYDSSSNYMLKLLEEPPSDSFLILVTTRRSAMIPTVRSRLRPYLFVERKAPEQAEVLKRIFHEGGGDYRDLREYFLYWKDVNPAQLAKLARRFVEAALENTEETAAEDMLSELEENFSPKTARGFVSSFLEEILRQLLILLREQALNPFLLRRWNGAIRRHQQAFLTFNQQPSLTLESLYYCLRTIR
jgi:DNA polymerase-3 subunit gamma/tau